jgi:hypothetical protein
MDAQLAQSTVLIFVAYQREVIPEVVHARPGNVLVAVRNPNALSHVERVLEQTDTEEQDVVVVTVKLLTGPHSAQEQARRLSYFWERQPERRRRQVEFRIIEPDGSERVFYLA